MSDLVRIHSVGFLTLRLIFCENHQQETNDAGWRSGTGCSNFNDIVREGFVKIQNINITNTVKNNTVHVFDNEVCIYLTS